MTRSMKLTLIAVLVGSLALIGCASSSSGGTAGSGGEGGMGGEGGAGGEGGTGGVELPECGGDRTINESWNNDEQALTCSASGFTLGFRITLSGNAADPVQVGDNTYDLAMAVVFEENTVNLIEDSATIESILGIAEATMGTAGEPSAAEIMEAPVPCTVTVEPGTERTIVTPSTQQTWALDDGTTQEITMQDVTIVVKGDLLTVDLSTTGDEPLCTWDSEAPSIIFEGEGGRGGAGGAGGEGGTGGVELL